MRPEDEHYFELIESELDEAFAVAETAKERGGDPEPEVEIPTARDMADRVENILGIDGVAERVRELDGKMSREEAALELVEDFVDGRVGSYESKGGKVEGAVRTAVALLTEGVVAAPIEGIDRVEVNENDDGTEYVAVYYAGPIRSAGGTAQALSVLVADYARALLDIDEFKPRDDEIERYAEEVDLYDSETGLQYSPKDKETKFITKHCPIMLDGEATGDEEVSGFRDLERINTNASRGGMCLVLAEGIALKAPKIQRYTRNLDEVEWPWLQDLIDGTIGKDDGDEEDDAADEDDGDAADEDDGDDEPEGPPRADRNGKFLLDLIAGRPVFSHPSEAGGFRLRYGRTRNLGDATAGIHPATMRLVDDFLAPGTQIKTELPGKAAGIVPVDSIEGPTVRLANGEVRRIDDAEEALEYRNGVEKIIDAGEYLVNYGEFVENNHPLVPASYAVEWWEQEMDAAGVDVQAMRDDVSVDLDEPSPEEAMAWAREYDVPLHPAYTYLWHDLEVEAFEMLAETVADGRVVTGDGAVERPAADDGEGADRPHDDPAAEAATGDLVIERTPDVCEALEALLVEHVQDDDRITVPTWRPLVRSLGITEDLDREWDDLSDDAREWPNAMKAVEEVAPFQVRERAPTRVGNRMGRPEKSEDRELSPAVHTLFPIGEAGGSQRDVATAAKHADSMEDAVGEVEVEIGIRRCPDCDEETYWTRCPDCGQHVEPYYTCPDCEQELEPDESGRVHCERCEIDGDNVESKRVDVNAVYREALDSVGERENAFDVLKGVKGLSSKTKTPEPVEKGVLRAKHDVSAFKDGTVRYDMTDLPVTAVKPGELDVSVEQFRQLGYEEDVHGDPLTHEDQVVELKVQDVILSEGAAQHMLKTADFVDDLLESYYGLEPYYDLEEPDDLVGELVFGMAPHTSAAVVGRVIGFTNVAGGYAHPYFHAAKRRNCFHPDTKIWYRDEAGDVHYERIEEFVEERLDDPRGDDFGTLIEDLDGEIRVPSLSEGGEPTSAPVSAVSKHPSPDHLIDVETDSGRSITVTADHSMLRWTADGIENVRASELEPGDEIPAAGTVPLRKGTAPAISADGGGPQVDTVERAEPRPSTVDHTYCLTVDGTHNLVADGMYTAQCDGDEDCVMLLMDGLLNFSKSYLPDQRGGSVAEDSRLVAIDPDGDVRFTTFDEFWNELDTEAVREGKFYKKPCSQEGWKTFAFDDDHRAAPKPVEKAIRYRADGDEELLRITTQFGRSIDITESHSLFRYDGELEAVASDDLSEGDLVVAPQAFDLEPDRTTIDVAACLDDPYVFIDDEVETFLTDVWEATPRGSDVHAAFNSGLSYRLSRNKISLHRLETIAAEANREPPLEDATIGLWGSESGIDPTIDVDGKFAWLLGVFVAEGSLAGSSPALFNSDEGLVERVAEVTERILGVEPTVEWSNKSYRVRFPSVFEPVLYELGFEDRDEYSSSEKVVPESILRADREKVLSFLRGLMAGDGSEITDDNHTSLRFHTTSEDVKDGVVFLLHRLGIVANVSQKERDESRQPIYSVSVGGGASDNPLRRILDDEDPYQPKSLVVRIPDALFELRELPIPDVKEVVPKYLKRRENVSLEKLEEIVEALDERHLSPEAKELVDELRPLVDGDLSYLRIEEIERVDYDGFLYDLQVGGDPVFTASWLYAHNSMDAPLVMSSRIDPSEIDDEAHNVDVVEQYPREFYEATRELVDPGEVDVEIVEDSLGTDQEYTGFGHTHETTDIAAGPDLSAYKTLDSMMDKMDAQLELARKLRAVDEVDVAERVIEYHFLPDLIGNLRAFARQEVRCLDCGESFRRAPLTGDCRECGGDVTLTVHEGSVNKYMETAIEVAEEYGCRTYTKQRLEVLQWSIDRVFENDKNKASSLDDFM